MKKLLIGIFFISVLFHPLSATNQESDRQLFTDGLSAYRAGSFPKAETEFFKILRDYPQSRLTTAALLMLAKSYYKERDLTKVVTIVQNFFNRYPASSYQDDMHHLLGEVRFRQGRYSEAVEEWLWVIGHSRDPRLKRRDGEYVYKTMDIYLDEAQIARLQRQFGGETFQGLVTILKAKKLMEKGEKDRASAILRKFLDEMPDHIYADEARRLLKGDQPVERGAEFVFLKPMEGDFQEIGDDIELGMRYAIYEYEARNPGSRVGLKIADVGASVLSAAQAVLKETRREKPEAFIGPVDPDQSAAVALAMRFEKVPQIVPLSSETGLTDLSSTTFQINPDVETKGRFMGEYAVQKLGLKHLAVLAPVSEYGKAYVQSFVEAVQANGGEVVSDQWYYEDAQDFTLQFKAIRKKGFWISFLDSINQVDSTMSQDSLQANYQRYLDHKFGEKAFGFKIDSTQVPSTGIDGLLIVTTPDKIPFIAPQFAFHNIKTTLLGNEGWNDRDQLKKYRQYLDGLVYSTAAYYDPQSWNYKEFMNRFRLKMKATPGKFHLLGYDLMKWVLSHYHPGMSREELVRRLAKARLYQGILEKIEFNDSKPRVNTRLTVLKFQLGQIVQVN